MCLQALLRMEEAGRETPPRALLQQYVQRAQEMKRQHQVRGLDLS